MTLTETSTVAAWHEWRRQGIGGSDVAAVLDISPWSSPWSVWAEKVGLIPPDDLGETEAVAAGRWLERAIGPWFTHKTGLEVAGEQAWMEHLDRPTHRATVDGLVFDDASPAYDLDDALGVLEIKVTGPGRRWDDPPPHYLAQVQWQMHVTGLVRAWLAVLMGRRLDIHEIEADPDEQEFIADRVDRFWGDHVVAKLPPPVDGHDATLDAIGQVWPEHVADMSIDAGMALATEVDAWRMAKAAKKEAEAAEKRHAAAIKAAMGGAEIVTVDGQKAVSWKTQTTRRLDQKALKAAHPEIAAAFTYEDTSRVMRSHAPKETKQ